VQVGILPFENVVPPPKVSSANLGTYRVDSRYDHLQKAFTDMLTSDLAAFSSIRLLERSKIESLTEEIRFHATGAVDEKTALRLGAAAGAQILIYGMIDKQKDRIVIRTRLVDIAQQATTGLPEVSGEEADILELEQRLAASAAKALGLKQTSPAERSDGPTGGRLAVLPFHNNSGTARRDNLKLALADMAVCRLLRDGRFTLVERARIDLVLKEQGLQLTGIADERTAVRVGKLLGASALLLGAFFDGGNSLRIDARIVEIESGKTLVLSSVCVKDEEFGLGIDRMFDRLPTKE